MLIGTAEVVKEPQEKVRGVGMGCTGLLVSFCAVALHCTMHTPNPTPLHPDTIPHMRVCRWCSWRT